MNLLASEKSWLLAPVAVALWAALLACAWATMTPGEALAAFDADGRSPVELMTLPLFALIVPLAWLCPPNGGGMRRQCLWSSLWSLLAAVAIVRETDLHKALFAKIWPAVDAGFKGTVFKMRFLRAADVPLAPKLFVIAFFAVFFAVVAIPLARYLVPLVRGFFKMEPVCWTMAFFGAVSAAVLVVDRLPSKLKHAGVVLDDSALALAKICEEGGEALMALLALLAILQSHALFGRAETGGEAG